MSREIIFTLKKIILRLNFRVSHDQNAILWEWSVEKKKCTRLKHFCGHMESIESVSAHNDKIKFATGSWDNLIKIWSTGGNGFYLLVISVYL